MMKNKKLGIFAVFLLLSAVASATDTIITDEWVNTTGSFYDGTLTITGGSITAAVDVNATGIIGDGTWATDGGVQTGLVSATDSTAAWILSSLRGFVDINATGIIGDGVWATDDGVQTGLASLTDGTADWSGSSLTGFVDVNATNGVADGTWATIDGVQTGLVSLTDGTMAWTLSSITGATDVNSTSVTATNFVVGANTLTTTEWAILDGITAKTGTGTTMVYATAPTFVTSIASPIVDTPLIQDAAAIVFEASGDADDGLEFRTGGDTPRMLRTGDATYNQSMMWGGGYWRLTAGHAPTQSDPAANNRLADANIRTYGTKSTADQGLAFTQITHDGTNAIISSGAGDIQVTPSSTDYNVIIPTDCAGNCATGAISWNATHICVCESTNTWVGAATS